MEIVRLVGMVAPHGLGQYALSTMCPGRCMR